AGADSASDLERVITGSSTEPLRTPALTQSITALSPVDDLTKLGVDLRKPAVRNDLEAMKAARPKHSRVREFWAGLGLMPATFNPKMNVTSAPRAFASANAGRQSLGNASRSRLSYAVQALAGKQLSKHWSVETGVSYLQGNSTFESDGYVLNAVTSESANVLQDALNSNSLSFYNTSKGPGFAQNLDASTASYIDFDQRTSNDYRYVQLPVQAGYTLNPNGKLNYTVLGGVVANLFLQNEIKDKAGYVFANTADDGLYKSLNWSAATGVRVNYRLGDHWNASLTGSYQKAIASILKGDGVLDSRPQLYGMSWGVRYVF
uniref:outer membrane beta-barrel protein n=1 Tax=Persicitalea sp. TaxID=3100273 RepID=UPI003594783B